jgi:hypothetical protein
MQPVLDELLQQAQGNRLQEERIVKAAQHVDDFMRFRARSGAGWGRNLWDVLTEIVPEYKAYSGAYYRIGTAIARPLKLGEGRENHSFGPVQPQEVSVFVNHLAQSDLFDRY